MGKASKDIQQQIGMASDRREHDHLNKTFESALGRSKLPFVYNKELLKEYETPMLNQSLLDLGNSGILVNKHMALSTVLKDQPGISIRKH